MIENRMENHAKTMLGCEVASDILFGWLLGQFWARIGVPNCGPFSQIEDPKIVQIRLHRQSRLRGPFWSAFGPFLDRFWRQFS